MGTSVRSTKFQRIKPFANKEREQRFRLWYAKQANALNLDRDPDNPLHFYNWRAAFSAKARADKEGHWPSEFKLKGHPNLIVDGIDTRSGLPVNKGRTPLNLKRTMLDSVKELFGASKL